MSRGHGVLALTSLFGGRPENPAAEGGDDRLLDLYWNRAQLKKEYAALRKERFTLLDALKDEEGKTARLRQKLEYLEDLLAEPESASSTVVYYNLRRVWRACNNRLLAFSKQLREQCEQREVAQLQQRWRGDMEARLRALSTSLKDKTGRLDGLNNEAQYLSARLSELSGFWNFFKRRAVREELAVGASCIAQLEIDIDDLKRQRSKLAVNDQPRFEHLSLDSRRVINFTVIALADFLMKHYSVNGIADLARTVQQKSAGGVQFGTQSDCQAILRQIADLTAKAEKLERDPSFVAKLKDRASQLRARAAYNKDTDAIPTPGSLNGKGINVLAEDYWSVTHALML